MPLFLVIIDIGLIVPILLAVAYVTLLERKIMGAMQRRKGPNVVGTHGFLQAFADGLKLFVKESIIPSAANKKIYIVSPVLTLFLSFIGWAIIPFKENITHTDINIGILYSLAISSLGVYGIICSGWASNSKYSFLGALRSAAQMISYEVSLGLIILTVLLLVGSLSLIKIVLLQIYVFFVTPLFISSVMFFISSLAETNRAPFDFPEAESELVSGFSTEYASMGFAFFFIGEYSNMLLMCALNAVLFFGGWWALLTIILLPEEFWFGMKISALIFVFVWVRVALPRFRYDQLMRLGWKSFLPASLGKFTFVGSTMLAFDALA